MPIIAKVGRGAPKVRLTIFLVYSALIVGSLTTVYPFWLMVAGSISSNHTSQEFRLIPRYLYNERALFEAHIWHKYYRYGGVGDIQTHWKVMVPGTYGDTTNRWVMVPGERPGPRHPVTRVLFNEFCAKVYERFREDYDGAGAPTEWTTALHSVVEKHYPFAVEAVRGLVEENAPFELKRHMLLRTLKGRFGEVFGAFAQEYDAAGRPDSLSRAFARIAENYPWLCGQPLFLKLMREYCLSRKPDLSDERVGRRVQDYRDFRETLPITHRDCFWIGGHRTFQGDKEYRAWLKTRYGTLEAVNEVYGTDTETWVRVFAPWDHLDRRSMYVADTTKQRDWYEWKLTTPAKYIRPAAVESRWSEFLRKEYDNDIRKLNEAYGADYVRFYDIALIERVPAEEGPRREDWVRYVRERLAPRFMRFDGGVDAWRAFVIERFGTLESANTFLSRSWKGEGDIALPFHNEPTEIDADDPLRLLGYPATKRESDLLLDFVKEAMPAEHIRVATGENLYRAWLLEKYGSVEGINEAYGTHEKTIEGFYFPAAITDWEELTDDKWSVKKFTLFRAYGTAVDHIMRHKRSLWNTAVYCTAVVLAALVINPMCAYALSRFNLPGSYKVLLFMLATMAFPAEVTMIPNFLLLKSFPLLQIVMTVAGFLIGGSLMMMFTSSKRLVYPFVGAVIGGVLGGTIVTEAAKHIAGLTDGKVTLLNTYWALILPGVASGYSVFILKGFFDSLPSEIYDSAVVDGAGEIRIFAQITLPMSKPVLAVIALWSFTAAYGSFTWALIICQDPKMWTLMVHLYQYQMLVDPCEVLSALTLASLPTLVVFLITQKVILKGIILPTYK